MRGAAIVGATGYAGQELAGLLARHPEIGPVHLMSARPGAEVKTLGPVGDKLVHPLDLGRLSGGEFDVVFACLPHGVGIPTVQAALDGEALVVDLSADLRFQDPGAFAAAYGAPHAAPELCSRARYGLTEHDRESLAGARLIANPGCYPTATLLGLLPLMDAGLVKAGSRITVDAKSGVSGAGKSPSDVTLYGNVDSTCRAYGVGNHRHSPEIASRFPVEHPLSFVPHLLPMFRGMLATIYVEPAEGASLEGARSALAEAYTGESFVHLLDEQPRTGAVAGTNQCHLNIASVSGAFVVTSAIDNLVKGAAGQAVQNMNVALGYDETWGLA